MSFFRTFYLMISILIQMQTMATPLCLRENLKKAQEGDYIVTMQNKTYTLLHISEKSQEFLTLEEITLPEGRASQRGYDWQGWKQWVSDAAPGNCSWVKYQIHLPSGQMQQFFSFTKNAWINLSQADNFLSTLLNLNLQKIPYHQQKKVGAFNQRRIWQPRLIFEGKEVPGVSFDAWQARWPRDGSELSMKTMTIYLPEDNDAYPAYFPYWLQIQGKLAKAKIRIIDSGKNLSSPQAPIPNNG